MYGYNHNIDGIIIRPNQMGRGDETHTCFNKLSKNEKIEKNVKCIIEFSSPKYYKFHKTCTI